MPKGKVNPQSQISSKAPNPSLFLFFFLQALRAVHINIVDLLQAKKDGKRPRHFPTHRALVEWTTANRKRIFPLRAAKENGFLAALLEEMHF